LKKPEHGKVGIRARVLRNGSRPKQKLIYVKLMKLARKQGA